MTDVAEQPEEDFDPEEAHGALLIVREVAQEFQRQNHRLRQIIAVLAVSLFVILCGAAWYGYHASDLLAKQEIQADDIERVTENTNTVVKDVKRLVEGFDAATSEEARKRQQEQLDLVITRLVNQMDCNTRQAIQDALQQIVAQAGLRPINVLCEGEEA